MSSHDPAYKQLFSYPEMITDLVRGYVHEEWVEQIDFSTLERVADSFVSDDLREREDDIIWRVRWGEKWLYLYLLIEFQSTVSRFMAVRLLTYIGLLYQDLIRTEKVGQKERLPPVLPIVLYNGEERWWARTDLAELMEEELPDTLAQFQPKLRYLLLDEGRFADHPLPTVRNLVSALFGLENSRSPDDMIQVLDRLLQWLSDPSQSSLRRTFVVWLKRVGLQRHLPETEFSEIHELQEMHTMLAERVKSWHEQWEQKGIEKGMEKGMKKGLQKGESKLLRHQLIYRFGPALPNWIEARLQAATTVELEAWGLAFVKAQTLEEIFGDDEMEH